MPERSDALARILAMLTRTRRGRRRSQALLEDRTLQRVVADVVAARIAAGMTRHVVATQM